MPDAISTNDNRTVWRGSQLESSNGRAQFRAQNDGNILVYHNLGGTWTSVWATHTDGNNSWDTVVINDNGELVACLNNDVTRTAWKSGSWNSGQPSPFETVMQDDGNLVIYSIPDRKSIWATNTFLPSPKTVKNLYFEADGNYTNIFRLYFPFLSGKPSTPIFSVGQGITHDSTGVKDIMDAVWDKNSNAKGWLQNGEIVECGAGGVVDQWSFNSPLYSEYLQYGGTMCISVVLSGSVAAAEANFKIG